MSRKPASQSRPVVLCDEDLTALGGLGGVLTNTQLRASPVPVAKGQQQIQDCTITSGQSLSAGVDLGVFRLVGLSMPTTLEPTTLTFQSSFDGTNWNNIFTSAGTEVTVISAASRRIIVAPADFYGVRYLRVRGGTSGVPTTVAADRIIKLISEA